MTQDELLQAINASGLSASGLATVLKLAGALVERESLKAGMAKVQAMRAEMHQQAEAELQALQQKIDAIEAQLAAQA